MIIAVNARTLRAVPRDGIGWFTLEVVSGMVRNHPEHRFVLIGDRRYGRLPLKATGRRSRQRLKATGRLGRRRLKATGSMSRRRLKATGRMSRRRLQMPGHPEFFRLKAGMLNM